MLTTLPTVPNVQSGEVVGLDGKVWAMLCADGCTLWVSSQYMAGVQLDMAGVRCLIGLLREIEAQMAEISATA